MEAYAVRVAARAAEPATDSMLALDENAVVDNVERGEVGVEDPRHFDSAQMGRVMMMQCKWMMVVTLEKERSAMLAGWIVCSQKREKHRLRWCVKL